MLRKSLILAVILGLGITGCSSASVFDKDAQTPPSHSDAPAPTETAGPTPTQTGMPIADAADYYLETVCPVNATLNLLQAVSDEPESTMEDLKGAAAFYKDANVTAIMRLEQPPASWPETVSKDMTLIATQMQNFIDFADEIIAAPSLEAMTTIEPFISPGSQEAGPRVRAALGITQGTVESCAR